MSRVVNPLGGNAVVSGVGVSQIGRRLGRSGLALTVEACLRAIDDAGLTPDDIDGVASYPGAAGGGTRVQRCRLDPAPRRTRAAHPVAPRHR